MPDGTSEMRCLGRRSSGITRRFDSLSPYNRKIVPHLLRLTKENFNKIRIQRQLYGLSIAAKRYALYTTKCGNSYCGHSNCVKIVDPKAHGLIFFAPSDEREKGLPKWWWELWRFLLTSNLGKSKSRIQSFDDWREGSKCGDCPEIDSQPKWISLPAMMKMRISTPHFFEQMKGKVSPYGFVLHPRTRENAKLTLLTPFSKNREMWAKSLCINTRDGKLHRLDEISRADVITLGDILCGYIQHPEIKSLGPDGEKCSCRNAWSLTKNSNIGAAYITPSGRKFHDLSKAKTILSKISRTACIRYDGGRVAANESLKAEIKKLGLRKTTKETGLDRKTIRAVLTGEKVKVSTLAKVVNGLQSQWQRPVGLRFPGGRKSPPIVSWGESRHAKWPVSRRISS